MTTSTQTSLAAPLDGIRVLDVTRFLAGPYAGMILADLGADVIKLEDPARPDEARTVGPYFQGDQSLYFAALNSGKRSVAINQTTPEGHAVVKKLAASCDVVLDNNKPGVMEKLGLSPELLRASNPKLVTCSLSGFGATGPARHRPGYDYTIQALGGVMSLTGEPDGPPGKAGMSYVDHSGGITAALAICAALLGGTRTGRGRHIDLALLDIQISMLSYLAAWHLNAGYEGERTANAAHPSLVPAQNFETMDGYISLFVGNDAMWSRLATALADPSLAEDSFDSGAGRLRHRSALVDRLSKIFKSGSNLHWVQLLDRHGVPCAPVNSLAQALADPQVQARGLTSTAIHPDYGEYAFVGGPMVDLRERPLGAAPRLGEHTRAVMRELGSAKTEVDTWIELGTLFDCSRPDPR